MLKSVLPSRSSGGRISTVFKQFAKRTSTMYMGTVDQTRSDYHLVRGFTASHRHKDTDHCIGTFLHHDFIVLHRTTEVGRVVITEVDLHTIHPFTHFFIVPNSIEPQWFDKILQLYPHHRHAPFAPHDTFSAQFKDTYSILSLPTHFDTALYFAESEVAKSIMSLQSQRYVIEVLDRSVFLYNFDTHEPSDRSLDVQVRFGCTLASALETKNK